jgi:oxalate decarboxylase/phosphoglucose isomerase-like protein (cupin superfamily)
LNDIVVKRIRLLPHEDKDGRGFEIQGLQKSVVFKGKNIQDIVMQSVRPKKDRGDHCHKRKTEWFIALKGKAELLWADNLNPKKSEVHKETFEKDFDEPYVFEIPPLAVHTVINNSCEDFIMASFCSEEYDSSDIIKVKIPR